MLKKFRLRRKKCFFIKKRVCQAKYILYKVKYTFIHSLIRVSRFGSYLKAYPQAYLSNNKGFLNVHDQHQFVYIHN